MNFHWEEISHGRFRPDEQYFDVLPLSEHEVIVDCGAFDGDNMAEFIKRTNGKFDRYWAFELDPVNYGNLNKRIAGLGENIAGKISAINKGVLDREEVFNISSNGVSSSLKFDDDIGNKTEVSGCPIDSVVTGWVTMIKMDVEGAELAALKGAELTIRREKPVLAICVYHKPEDIWEIPHWVLGLGFETKIYLRHYSPIDTETVMCFESV